MSTRSDRLAAQAETERAWRAEQNERPAVVTPAAGVPCHAALGRTCYYVRSRAHLWRCVYCCRLSLRSALYDAGIGREEGSPE